MVQPLGGKYAPEMATSGLGQPHIAYKGSDDDVICGVGEEKYRLFNLALLSPNLGQKQQHLFYHIPFCMMSQEHNYTSPYKML